MEENLNFKLSDYSPLVLAYMGDAYFEVLVRAHIIGSGDCKPGDLNIKAKDYITAVSQSRAVEKLVPILSEFESMVYKSGRNAKSNHTPKSADAVDYRRATGLETLFGYFYLSGNLARAKELFELVFE